MGGVSLGPGGAGCGTAAVVAARKASAVDCGLGGFGGCLGAFGGCGGGAFGCCCCGRCGCCGGGTTALAGAGAAGSRRKIDFRES